MLVAIDSSAGTSVAVVHDGAVLAVADESDPRSHAEVIGVLLSAVLRDAHVRPDDLDAVAVGMGPGPFTGLRVGIAAARALAFGAGIPVLPVASHDAVAADAGRPCVVVTDARRRESAWSAYAAPDGPFPVRVAGPLLSRTDELDADLERELRATPGAPGGSAGLERIATARIPADALGLLAERVRSAGCEPGPAEPLYLRAPDVTLSQGPKRVTA